MTKTKGLVWGYLHWLIGILIMLLGGVLPASAPLTPMGVQILMIFVGMIYLWCTVNPIGASLLVLFAVSLTGYMPFSTILSTAISDSNWVILFFSCILFISSIECGMPNYISHGIFKATQNVVTGRPMMLIFILMLAAFVVSAMTDVIPTILVFWGICYAIIDELQLTKRDPYSMLLVMSCFLGAMLGNAMLPFKGATLIILSAFEAASGMTMPYGAYITVYALTALIIMVLYCLGCKYLFRVDMSKVQHIDGHMLAKEKLAPMSLAVKAHLFAVLAFIAAVLVTSVLPQDSAVYAYANGIGTQGYAVLLVVFLFIIRDREGAPVIQLGKVMGKMPWPAMFMVMAAVFMAGALKDKDATGVIPWLKKMLTPVLGGHNEFIFALIIIAIAMFLTCFFHNGALGNMLMPVLFAVADGGGYHSIAIAACLTMAINIAFLAPSASNWAPLLHGNKDYISVKEIWTIGLFFEILALVVYVIIGVPLARLMM